MSELHPPPSPELEAIQLLYAATEVLIEKYNTSQAPKDLDPGIGMMIMDGRQKARGLLKAASMEVPEEPVIPPVMEVHPNVSDPRWVALHAAMKSHGQESGAEYETGDYEELMQDVILPILGPHQLDAFYGSEHVKDYLENWGDSTSDEEE